MRRRNWRIGNGWWLVVAGVWGALPVLAQPTLHEPVQVPRLRCRDGVCKADGAPADAMPEAVMSSDGLVPSPSGGRSPIGQEQIFASGATTTNLAQSQTPPPGTDPPPVRRARILPDSATGPETGGERLYHEVFQPAVYPYKRMSALDGVDDDGAMKLRRPELSPVEIVKGPVGPGRDPFYGSVVVDLVAGQPAPLPTPAAGIRILSYRATPTRSLQFFFDGADNLYVTSPAGGRHRVVYLMDVAPRYFAGPLLSPGVPAPLLGDVPDALLAPLPRRLQREATTVLRHIGVRTSSGADYQAVLAQLVSYFRGFTVGELPEDGAGDLYLKLAMSRRGACRHRSYAFVITALQAGIPARYVENELHVFVEVWIPDTRGKGGYFRRINLGGAPLSQRVVDGENKVAYREKGSDPFPIPPNFYSGVPPQVPGQPRRRDSAPSPASASGDADTSSESKPKSGSGDSPGSGGKQGDKVGGKQGDKPVSESGGKPGGKSDGTSGGTSGGKPGDKPGDKSDGTSSDKPTSLRDDGSELPAEDDLSLPEDRRTEIGGTLSITQVSMAASPRAYRGSTMAIRGIVRATSGSAGGLEVLVILALPGSARVLGRAVSQPDGRFALELELPGDLPLGDHRLVARVRGDETRRGSSSGRYDALSDR